jgi:cytochrome c oxidase subunit 2
MNRFVSGVLLCAAVLIPTAFGKERPTCTIHAKKYAFVPAEITLKRGKPATLLLISDDVPHGLAVKALGIRADMIKGAPVEVLVTPPQVGDFQGTCSRYCGAGHSSMSFVVHVVP